MGADSTSYGDTEPPVVELIDATGCLCADAVAWLKDRAQAAVRHLGVVGEVRVRVVGDLEMAGAHREFLECDGTTDVITFDMSESNGAGATVLDVDMLACVDEASRQASARGHAPERELLLYIVHGVLHCLGYDDHDEEQFNAMHAREDEVLRAIGVGATFSAASPGGAP